MLTGKFWQGAKTHMDKLWNVYVGLWFVISVAGLFLLVFQLTTLLVAEFVDQWMRMEPWWNDTDWGILKYLEKNVLWCHFVCHKSRMDWPGPEAGPLVRGQWLAAWDMAKAKPATGLNMLTMMELHDSGILLIRMDTVLYLQTHITLQAV
jgi:hypothetical protein